MFFRTSKCMYVYIDESGAVRASDAFVAGMFLTWEPIKWQKICLDRKTNMGFPGELHFHKISRSSVDLSFRMINILFDCLLKYKNWYGRFIFVSKDNLFHWNEFCNTIQDVYDLIILQLLNRFGSHIPEANIKILLDETNRLKGDNYIPKGLEYTLCKKITQKNITVEVGSSYTEPLLQIADNLTSDSTPQTWILNYP